VGDALNKLVKLGKVSYIVPRHKRVKNGNVEDVDTYKVTRRVAKRDLSREYGTRDLGGGLQFPGLTGGIGQVELRRMMRTSPYFPARARRTQTGSSEPDGVASVTPSLGRVRADIETTDYFELPFNEQLERQMKVDIHFSSASDYAARRDKLFAENGALVDVPFDGLITTQRTVGSERDPNPTVGLVVRHGGRNYLIHGHDSAVRSAQTGADSFPALFLNLDQRNVGGDPPPRMFEWRNRFEKRFDLPIPPRD
jgi:hypothetical protein